MKRFYTSLMFSVIMLSLFVFMLTGCFHTHTVETDAEIPATCTSEGKTEGSHCSECGDVILEQILIPMLEHTAVADSAIEATCAAEGRTAGTHCSVCGENLSGGEVISKLEHTIVTDEAVAPSCTSEGKTEGSHCSVCNEVLVAQETVEKIEHTVVTEPIVEATCIAEGSTAWEYCSVCNAVIKEKNVIPKTEHTVVKQPAVEATCSSEGYTEGSYCSVCNEVFEQRQTLAKLEHTPYQIPEVASTCMTEGKTAVTKCSVCGEFLGGGLTLFTQPHEPVEIPGRDATCTSVGLSNGYTCSMCGDLITTQKETPKIPHNFSGNKCTVCGYVKNTSGSATVETGLTLNNLLNKDISILKDFSLIAGNSVDVGFKTTSISDSRVYVTTSDVLGYPCKIYAVTTSDSRCILGIYCYAEMGILYRNKILDETTVANHTKKTMDALNAIFNTINNNASVTTETIEDVHGIFAPTPTVYPIKYSDIYDNIYMRYPTGFVCTGGIIRFTGRLVSSASYNFSYRLYVAQYSTDGGWYAQGNCIVLEY